MWARNPAESLAHPRFRDARVRAAVEADVENAGAMDAAGWRCQGEAIRVNRLPLEQRRLVMNLDELVFHPWAVQGPRDVPTLVGGSGSYVIDASGRRYLDFSSQLVFTNLGHQHPRIVAAIREQAEHLCTIAPAVANGTRS